MATLGPGTLGPPRMDPNRSRRDRLWTQHSDNAAREAHTETGPLPRPAYGLASQCAALGDGIRPTDRSHGGSNRNGGPHLHG
eukprot:11126564-Prorocentrum_lima.AAC.1